MNRQITEQYSGILHRAAMWTLSVLLLSACATTDTERKLARVELQDSVGFTIVEAVRVGNSVRSDYDVALKLLERGEREQGIELLEDIVLKAPLLSAPRIDLGIAYHRAGDMEAAEANLSQALELNPQHPIVHNELGILYREAGRFADARKSYEAALEVYPRYHFARRNLAVLCDLYLADLNCALENYESYMATVRSDDEVAMWISDVRRRIKQ